MRILIINGPNINMLGIREPDIYGKNTYADLCGMIEAHAAERGIEVKLFQSNHEGSIVDEIQAAYGKFDGIVINPAAYTHTSIAILDALKSVGIPAVEVHISDVTAREDFRQISYAGMACEKSFVGLGFDGYIKGIEYLINK
ncbi:MAG: type II 3-dehydroquinate dehydratase [Clostridia bacterium]|nr:type II 3-dehydroquinate dehydratase [Clostridia bacterium]